MLLLLLIISFQGSKYYDDVINETNKRKFEDTAGKF